MASARHWVAAWHRGGFGQSVCRGLAVGAAVLAVVIPPQLSAERGVPQRDGASFGSEAPSPDARLLAHWVARSRDNANTDFLVVDKKFARLHVFDADARLRASSPVLIGAAVGDDSVPGIGARPIAAVRPEERTTPAGRFVAERGRNALGEEVIWVDYGAAVSMHRVRTTEPSERRLERLATPTIDDKRISYGCINVPVDFFERHVLPIFATRRAIVYVLPEVKPAQQVFDFSPLATLAALT